ncbi:MAG: hypothetical protein ACFFDN_17855 [Candidatus Hodarchaeota archaeon]
MQDKFNSYSEIKDDRKEGKKGMIVLFIILWIISSNLIAIISQVDLFNYLLTLLISFLILVIPALIIVVWGTKKVKTIISDYKIEFYIGKSLYFKTYWKDLELINIFQEKFYNKKRKINMGYVIEFYGSSINKIIRLWCFPFHINKQKTIIQSLKNYIHKIGKLEITENPLDDEIKIKSIECGEINDFI